MLFDSYLTIEGQCRVDVTHDALTLQDRDT